jgi:hypothetical protein
MENKQVTPQILKKFFNSKIDLPELLKKYSHDNYHYEYNTPCYCPFHDNHNSPAAVIYPDEEGDNLWCFSEQKMYTAFDYFELILNTDPYPLAKELWDTISDVEKSQFLSKHSVIDYRSLFNSQNIKEEITEELNVQDMIKQSLSKDNTYKEDLSEAFKYGQIDKDELISKFYKLK